MQAVLCNVSNGFFQEIGSVLRTLAWAYQQLDNRIDYEFIYKNEQADCSQVPGELESWNFIAHSRAWASSAITDPTLASCLLKLSSFNSSKTSGWF